MPEAKIEAEAAKLLPFNAVDEAYTQAVVAPSYEEALLSKGASIVEEVTKLLTFIPVPDTHKPVPDTYTPAPPEPSYQEIFYAEEPEPHYCEECQPLLEKIKWLEDQLNHQIALNQHCHY